MPNSRSLYGFRLACDWDLAYPGSHASDPGFGMIEVRSAPATTFAEALRNSPVPASDEAWHQYVPLADGSEYLRWPQLFEFLVSPDGTHIAARPLGPGSREVLDTYLLGQVLSHAMLKRGIEPLHATAVVVNGAAVAFMGDCGRGKSSLGASFIRAGYPLLTDDLLTLEQTARGVIAHRGPPRVKLFPETAPALLGCDVSSFPMNHRTRKVVIPLEPGQSHSESVPIDTIYVLAPASHRTRRISIRRLTAGQAVIELLRNTFNRDVTNATRLEQQFQHAAWVSRALPVKMLRYPRDFALLPAVHRAIAADLARGALENCVSAA